MDSASTPLLTVDDPERDSPGTVPGSNMAITTLQVDGMTCGACTSAVEGAFKGVEGVGEVSVSLVIGRAVVHHDPTRLSAEKVADMIEDRGFDARVLNTELPVEKETDSLVESGSSSRTTLSVKGMTCGACTSAVEGGFKDVPGIKSVTVSLLSERAVVEHDTSAITPQEIANIIEDRGFDATVVDSKVTKAHSGSSQSASKSKPTSITTTVAIGGMTCGACTSSVDNAFKDVPGVIRFNISLLAERAVITHDPSILAPEKIGELIEDAGFDAQIVSSEADSSLMPNSSASVSFNIYGLVDTNAAVTLERILSGTPGVSSADVKFFNTRASITYNPSKVGIRALVEVIEGAGLNALLAESDDSNAQLESLAKTREIQEWRWAFLFSLSFAIPVMVINMIIPMYLPSLDFGKIMLCRGLYLGDVACLLLTIPVQFGIGRRFYISSYKSLRHRSPTMDVLIILGTSTAFFFSVLSMFVSMTCEPHARPSTVFETSTMLITFITLGRWLENRAKGQTSRALSHLMSLAPSMATIYEDPIAMEKAAEEWDTEKEQQPSTSGTRTAGQKVIPTELIQLGDIVCLHPGDKVPADGTVIRGESYIDESMITGEAVPIRKRKGHQIMAGTVNGAGWLDFRVARAGRDTQLSQIVKLVQDAQTSRAPIQRMADVVSGYFVPCIITLGLITFFGWMILSHVLPNPPKIFLVEENGGTVMICLKLCISVIVFACPCALGLSTPTAVMVGTGVGAEHGILVKGGAALEAVTKITHVVFDKTGTLTVGKMSVAEAKIEPTWSTNDWRRRLWWLIVGLAEMTSEHPVGKAIVATAKMEASGSEEGALDGAVGDFEAKIGKGVSAIVEPASTTERVRYHVLLGNAVFLRSRGVQVPDSVDPDSQMSEDSAKPASSAAMTLIHVAIDNKYAGTICLQDTLKPTAIATVAALHRMGLTTSLVTGDTYSTALPVATAVGIPASSIHASVNPSEKQSIISSLQSTPSTKVAMVGDGINDSPALATASVGIALASGTDVAIEAADIVLMRPEDLLTVPESLCLAGSIFNRIRLNLIWACMYNVVGLPFAMGLFLPFGLSLHPMAAGAAMAASSISVVVSSLLLKLWKRPRWLQVEKLQREIDMGLIDSTGLGRRGRASLWRKSPFTAHSPAGHVRRGFAWATGLFGSNKSRRRTEDEGYVPLQTVESTV
ncbi:hypothetical protein AJ80_01034 [Polytolypa hystricis UAMH7299]|uniref:P-type Cu(+) transporter n=1 Tax=Polytolypa hystricis (strain UAMH7299) TaxID=1447883 RepID=A0A2B7YTF5_POLH7|nr:hypothetical protein AJ80_01034 [Polytolypa hystricis UAMH7299]